MSQLDLLTDTDFQTAPKKVVRWFNQWLIVGPNGAVCCACEKSWNCGEIAFSCCPTSYETFEQALEEAKQSEEWELEQYGHYLSEYMGTYPTEPQ